MRPRGRIRRAGGLRRGRHAELGDQRHPQKEDATDLRPVRHPQRHRQKYAPGERTLSFRPPYPQGGHGQGGRYDVRLRARRGDFLRDRLHHRDQKEETL